MVCWGWLSGSGARSEKAFLAQLEMLVEGRPIDVVKLRLDVPSVKGALELEKAPSFMSFEVTSTAQEDIQPFLAELRAAVRDKGLVRVNENKLGAIRSASGSGRDCPRLWRDGLRAPVPCQHGAAKRCVGEE